MPTAASSSLGRTAAAAPRRAWSLAVLGIGFAVAAAALLRFSGLGARSLWNDEFFSIYFARQGPAYILGEGARIETNPPLYYLLLWAWMKLWGDGEIAVRSLSAVLSLLAMGPLYRLGVTLSGRVAARAVLALFAVSGSEVYFAREARPFALFILAAACAFAALSDLLRAQPSGSPRRAWSAAAALTVSSILAVYAHDAGIILVASIDVILLASILRLSQRSRLARIVVAFNAVVALAAAPQLYIVLHQLNSPNIAWMRSGLLLTVGALQTAEDGFSMLEAAGDVKTGVMSLPLFGVVLAAALALALVTLAVVARGLWRRRRDWAVIAVCAALPAVALLALLVINQFRPIVTDRTLIWLLPSLLCGLGIGLAETRPTARTGLLAALIALEAVFCAVQFRYLRSEPWRALVAELARDVRPGDVVVVASVRQSHTPAIAVAYYWRGARLPDLVRWQRCQDCPSMAEATLDARALPAPTATPALLRDRLRAGAAVWVVARTPFRGDRADLEPLVAALDAAARPQVAFDWDDQLSLVGWRR